MTQVDIGIRLFADLGEWAAKHNVTTEEAERIFRERVQDASTRALVALTGGLGDMEPAMQAAGVSTPGAETAPSGPRRYGDYIPGS